MWRTVPDAGRTALSPTVMQKGAAMNNPTVNSEPTVEEALKQVQALIPDNKEWITCRSTVRWTGQGGNQHLGRFAEIEVGDESFISATLSEALEQVRKWKQEQSNEQHS